MKIGEVDQRSSPCIMYIMHTCIVHILRFCLLLIISSRIHQATCLLVHGWSKDLLHAWEIVSASNHFSQIELRRTYVEKETISARREHITQQLLGTLSHGSPTWEAHRLEGLVGLYMVGLYMQGASCRLTCCHPDCQQDQNLAICSFCLKPRCPDHRYIKSSVNSSLIITRITDYRITDYKREIYIYIDILDVFMYVYIYT